ncbi:MAG: sulfur carrier protein ThiS [Rikenellaceae bacterium]
MINIILNNQQHTVRSQTLQQLIEEFKIETQGVAIGINNQVIARQLWNETQINDGDKIVIVSAVFGG